jgi:hypothetical protein
VNITCSIIIAITFLLLALKIIIHIQLDNTIGDRIIVSPVSGWIYLLPYDKPVPNYLERRKRICNIFQKLSSVLLFLSIILLLTNNIINRKH